MQYKWLPVIDSDQCTGCRACVSYCVSGSLTIVDGIVEFKNPKGCLSDEWCVRECPSSGIHMEWLPISGSIRGIVADKKPRISPQSHHHQSSKKR